MRSVKGVTEVHVGEKVLALTHFGGYADIVCVPAITTFLRPPQMSPQVGAAMLVNYVTAYQLLVVMGSLHRGERVLIQSAAGGVGLAALDICRIYGAQTIGLASTARHAFLHSRGLDHALDSRTADVGKEDHQITNRESVEIA